MTHELDWARHNPARTTPRKGLPMKIKIAIVAVVAAVLTVLGAPSAGASTSWLSGHVQNIGWVDGAPSVVVDGATWAGSNGKGLRLEALRLNTPAEAAFTMRGHVQNVGWMDQKRDSSGRIWVGTTGKSLRLEAVQLTPIHPELVTVWCQAFVAGKGWLEPVKDGATCGTTGESRRMETVRIWIEQHGDPAKPTPEPDPTLSTVVTVGDTGLEQAGLANLTSMGNARASLALFLGDFAYQPPAQAFCDTVKASISGTVGWVQGNHENRDADAPTGNPATGDDTAAYAGCMPATPGSSGEVGVQQVIQIPGARVITASPQEAENGAYLPSGARYGWVRDQIRAAKTAGDWPILAMHEPHWTSGLHGSAGPESKALSELAVAEGVRLVLGAHDHNYSRITQGGTVFVVSGMGGHNLRDANQVPGFVTCTGKPGYLTLDITASKITGTVSGICADRFEITR